jgi:hypothetical protein
MTDMVVLGFGSLSLHMKVALVASHLLSLETVSL